jgi:hypothetical protein
MPNFTAKPLDNGKHAILEDAKYCFYNGEPFTCNDADVQEILSLLNGGVPVSEFFEDGNDEYYYGSPAHAENGDAWFYAGCEGAW